MSEILKNDQPEAITEHEFHQQLKNISAEMSNPPLQSEVKTNKFADNAKYVPIEIIEAKLDLYFPMAWQTANFKWQVVANEIVGSMDLYIWNPVLGQWIQRTGAGGVPIQMRSKEKGGSDDLTDVNNKVKVTLTKDFPHLKAECLKNACKTLGQTFGRDLNRDNPVEPIQPEAINDYLEALNACQSYKEAVQTINELPPLVQQTNEIQSRFKAIKLAFKHQKKEGNNG